MTFNQSADTFVRDAIFRVGHGLLVDDPNDGNPRYAVAPGGSYTYQLTVNQRASLNFYHPHPHMMTGEQVYRGLAGRWWSKGLV